MSPMWIPPYVRPAATAGLNDVLTGRIREGGSPGQRGTKPRKGRHEATQACKVECSCLSPWPPRVGVDDKIVMFPSS